MTVATHRTKAICRRVVAGAAELQRGVRQLLADKVSGTLTGMWLLIPEYLRLGAWDLLRGWTGAAPETVAPRLALQMVNEAALGVTGVRQQRCLSQRGFELAHGLPFVATDTDIHRLLAQHTVAEALALQTALGRIRYASGHFEGALLALDPHRLPSTSIRQMARKAPKHTQPAIKCSHLFFCIDATTEQPLCCMLGSSSRCVAQATPELLDITASILPATQTTPLLLADVEHFSVALFTRIVKDERFDLLAPLPGQPYYKKFLQAIPAAAFTHRWAGFATAMVPFRFHEAPALPLWCFAQRMGERPDEFRYKGFICTAVRDELQALTQEFPKRWHVEEFFNQYQDIGWKHAGTMNLNIRHGRATLALIAQAALQQLRQRLPASCATWSTTQLARHLFQGLDGDIRVQRDTIIVTYYNAPHADVLAKQYVGLPARLEQCNIDPRLPWLYGFKLDFRFK